MKEYQLSLEQKAWLDEQLKDFNCIYIGIHGSHLYGLNRPESDFDIKAVYLPSQVDLIKGNAVKTYQRKNDELDIEVEIKSLSSFLRSAKSCDTNCVDLLHTPEALELHSTDMWKILKNYKSCLYAKNMKGIIGYIKTHSHKYSNKIERLQDMQDLLILVEEYIKEMKIGEFMELRDPSVLIAERKYLKPVTLVKDHEQQYLEVCGKKYIATWTLEDLASKLRHEINRYGKRTNTGADSGLDAKSLSHALRVLFQLKEIIETKNLKFPLKDAQYIKDVKTGVITDTEEIMNKIDTLFEECTARLEVSDLPDEVDLSPMYAELVKYYFEDYSKLDKILSRYGDNWYDGFLAAKNIHESEGDDLDYYKEEAVLAMSEQAEQDWLAEQNKVDK